MATATLAPPVPRLKHGDRLTSAEFERRYDAQPDLKKAELIDGVVYMGSPVRQDQHSEPHFDFNGCLWFYRMHTPGVAGGDNPSLRLGEGIQPQPDGLLYVRPDWGGHVRIDDEGYIVKAPDLIAEISASSASFDLNEKLTTYRRHHVKEYIVWRVEDETIDHRVLGKGKYRKVEIERGVLRSVVFPGLWLAVKALVKGDMGKVYRTLQKGVRSEEHRAFVDELAVRKKA